MLRTLILALALGAAAEAQQIRLLDVRRIWDDAPHSAFTDLVSFKGKLFCTFREGDGHVHGADGRARVLVSEDGGRAWQSVAELSLDGFDLRDPKLSVTPDGRLMLTLGGSIYAGQVLEGRRPLVSFSDPEGKHFSSPREATFDGKVGDEGNWLWRVTWEKGIGYGVVYQADGDEWPVHLVTTTNGIDYEHRATWSLEGRPNETTLRFEETGEMVALVRREAGNGLGVVGRSRPPYTSWEWRQLPARLGGPNLLQLDADTWVVGTRRYPEAGRSGTATILAGLDSSRGFEEWVELPSGGDTSYPGMVLDGDRLLVSYYSSHEGRSSIYFAELQVLAHDPRPLPPAPIEFEAFVDETGNPALRGVFRVPEDRRLGPLGVGRTLDLDFTVFLATGPDPAPDPVVFVAGGPGQAATRAFGGVSASPLRVRRDLILIDQRGTNGNHALRCRATGNDGDPQTYLDPLFQPEAFRACAEELSRRADLTCYTTEIAAHDLDAFRAALGYEKLNLVGGSYGTRASLVFMRSFPASVRSAVLDGVAPLAFKNPLFHAAAAQEALDNTLAECAADPDCQRAYPDLEHELAEVLARLEKEPAEVRVPHPNGSGEEVTVHLDRNAFAEAMRVLLYYVPGNRRLPRLIHAAHEGDLAPFAVSGMATSRALRTQLALGMLLSVTCAEDLPRIREEEILTATAGTFLGDVRVRSQLEVCKVWPRAEVSPGFGDPVSVDVPTLVLSGTLDGVTPPRWGDEAGRHLPSSVHLVVPGGHGVGSIPCIAGIVADFIERGSTEGLDTSCVSSVRLPPFELGR